MVRFVLCVAVVVLLCYVSQSNTDNDPAIVSHMKRCGVCAENPMRCREARRIMQVKDKTKEIFYPDQGDDGRE